MQALRTLLAVAALACTGPLAHAAQVAVTGDNHSFGNAFAVGAGSYDTLANPDIDDSTTVPHASLVDLSAGPFDYYSITLASGGTLTLDIDYSDGFDHGGTALDLKLAVWSADGTLLGVDDDDPRPWGFPGPDADAGSFDITDPWLQLGDLAAGNYIVGVAYSGAQPDVGGWLAGGEIPAGGMYELQVSIAAAASTVPEPAPVLAWLAGTLLLARVRAQRGR